MGFIDFQKSPGVGGTIRNCASNESILEVASKVKLGANIRPGLALILAFSQEEKEPPPLFSPVGREGRASA
jgi:hypothetical protein